MLWQFDEIFIQNSFSIQILMFRNFGFVSICIKFSYMYQLTIWRNFFTNFLFLFRYRCSGTLVACQFAASGCDYRGPTKSMSKHQTECRFKKEGRKEFFSVKQSQRELNEFSLTKLRWFSFSNILEVPKASKIMKH